MFGFLGLEAELKFSVQVEIGEHLLNAALGAA